MTICTASRAGGSLPRPPLRAVAATLAMAIAMGMSGCSSVPVKPFNTDFSERNWGIRQANISGVQSFALKGRLAEAGIAGARGDLDWTQSGERFDFRVSGPLGVGALAISGDPKGVEIRSKNGVIVTGEPEAYMQEKLGWSLPLSLLRYWALGVPAPMRELPKPMMVKLDDAGRALTLKQSGWQIDYLEYQPVNSLVLPRKLTLNNGSRSFRIVIDEWSGTP
ncbi:MAG TPA: lipoprotein insertase outer membrane protein LolB [Nevskia sp.]|nr:lipoprotein insertase outer membrane protein LolB [Nevskia sp.]